MALHHDIAERLRNIAGLVGKHSPNAPTIEVNGDRVPAGIEQIAAETTLNTAADRLHAGRVSITVLGNVCRGKTTVLNALLGQELLPAGSQANTGGICKVEFGNNPDAVTLVMDDGSTDTVTREEFKGLINLPQGVSVTDERMLSEGLPDDLARLRYARLECASPLLKRGITLVDTLGFNAVNGKVQEETTRRFLNEASAVMLVLNTSPLVEQTDLDLLNACYYQTSKGTENVFIVINERIKGMSDAARDDLEKRAEAQLGLFFTDDNGNIDSARFRKRVFFVDPPADSNTGIPELEAALLEYVAEGIAMDAEVETVVRHVLLPTLQHVDTSIREQLAGYKITQEEFAIRARDMRRKLRALADDASDLHIEIRDKGQDLAAGAADHFMHFFTQQFADEKSAWIDDWEAVVPEVREILGTDEWWNFWKAPYRAIHPAKRRIMSTRMQGVLQRLLRKQIDAWRKALMERLEPRVGELRELVDSKVGEFSLEIDALERTLSERVAEDPVDAVKPTTDERAARRLAFTMGALTVDPNQFTGALVNPSFPAIMGRFYANIITGMAGWAILGALGGPAALGAIVLLFIEHAIVHAVDAERGAIRMAKKVGKGFRDKFADASDEMQDKIRDSIAGQVEELANAVREVMRRETETLEEQLDHFTLVRAADGTAAEIPRLETISTLVEAEFEEISRLVFGHVLTPEERGELGRSAFGVKTDENAGESAV